MLLGPTVQLEGGFFRMPEEVDGEARFNRNVMYALVITAIMLLVLPMFFVIGKSTNYSAYDDSGLGQLSDCLLYTSPSPRD